MGAEQRNIESLRRAEADDTSRFVDEVARSADELAAGTEYSLTDEGLLAVRSAQLVYSMSAGRILEETHAPMRFTVFRGREARKLADKRIKAEYFGQPYKPIEGLDDRDLMDRRSYVYILPDQDKVYTATEAYQHSWLFHAQAINLPNRAGMVRDLGILRHTVDLATGRPTAQPIFHVRTIHKDRVVLKDFVALEDGVELDELQVVAGEKKIEALQIVTGGLRSLIGHLQTKSGFAKSLKLALPTFE